MSERELGKIVAHHINEFRPSRELVEAMEHGRAWDVVGPQPDLCHTPPEIADMDMKEAIQPGSTAGHLEPLPNLDPYGCKHAGCWSRFVTQAEREEHERTCHHGVVERAEARLAAADQHLPTGAAERKAMPIGTGVIDYFPDALAAVAHCSKVGNDQHNPGQPLHWAKEKSTDEADCLIRHFVDRGKLDVDGVRHSAKVAWRALALLQREIEGERS